MGRFPRDAPRTLALPSEVPVEARPNAETPAARVGPVVSIPAPVVRSMRPEMLRTASRSELFPMGVKLPSGLLAGPHLAGEPNRAAGPGLDGHQFGRSMPVLDRDPHCLAPGNRAYAFAFDEDVVRGCRLVVDRQHTADSRLRHTGGAPDQCGGCKCDSDFSGNCHGSESPLFGIETAPERIDCDTPCIITIRLRSVCQRRARSCKLLPGKSLKCSATRPAPPTADIRTTTNVSKLRRKSCRWLRAPVARKLVAFRGEEEMPRGFLRRWLSLAWRSERVTGLVQKYQRGHYHQFQIEQEDPARSRRGWPRSTLPCPAAATRRSKANRVAAAGS